jgi:queuine tRNA-ribosyltransferase
MPTRNARNGTIFTTRGKINIRNIRNRLSEEPIDEGLDNYASNNFSMGYLRHLLVAGEITGLQLASLQNVAFYQWLMQTARQKILSGEYRQWAATFLDDYDRMTKVRMGKM